MVHTIISYVLIIGLFVIFLKDYKKIDLNNPKMGEYYLDISSSSALKGICAICIICTHWCTYNLHLTNESPFTQFIPFHFGHFCIIIFMFLSGYGIVTVELKKKSGWRDYLRGRMWKILKPAWIVSFFTLVIYVLWGPRDISMDTVSVNWLHEYMYQISHREFSAFFFAKYFILHLDWYVMTTLVLYLLLKISLYFTSDKMEMFGILCLLILFFYVLGRLGNFPAHYYRNLWAFPFGVLCAIKPLFLKEKRFVVVVVVCVVLNLLVEGIHYTVSAILALSLLMYVGFTNRSYKIKSRFLLYLGSISYAIYLIHRTVYNMLWTYNLLYIQLFIVITLLLAHVFTKIILLKRNS